jgi:flagellar biosynthesis protein FlhF
VKIRRFVAKDMRTALAQIKEELGADAVIMSNKKTAEGVELMAAVDYQSSTVQPATPPGSDQSHAKAQQAVFTQQQNIDTFNNVQAAQPASPHQAEMPAASLKALLERNVQKANASQEISAQPEVSAPDFNPENEHHASRPLNAEEMDIQHQLRDFSQRLAQANQQPVMPSQQTQSVTTAAPTAMETMQPMQQHNPSTFAQPSIEQLTAEQINGSASKAELANVQNEVAHIRKLLEEQVSGLMWQDMARKEPMRAMLVKRLLKLGLSEQVADQLSCFIPEGLTEDVAWHQIKDMLAGQINTTNNDIIHRGGVVSLVGPTGVGKTTTIAKLAARFAQIHGADEVVLISTDSYRIAGHEQLATYGRIIGCPVKLAKDVQSLDELLVHYRQKKLILIDTAGMGQRDMRLAEHLTSLIKNTSVRIRNYLVLAANAQQSVLQDSVERFKKIPLAGCIFTKLDESLSLGEIIATSIQNGLPIGYLTDGQRVPEDIKVANASKLLGEAEKLAQDKTQGFDWMPQASSSAVATQ